MTLEQMTLEQLKELLVKEEKTLDLALSNDMESLISRAQADVKAIKAEIESRQK